MAETAHARYRRQLEVLATDTAVIEAIDRIDRRHTGRADTRTWIRTYGRFDPDCAPFATLVLEATGSPPDVTRIDVFETRAAVHHAAEAVARVQAIGWLRITHLPFDPSLSTLPAIFEACGPATVVRYHPGRRCTLCFDNGEQVRFAKVYADDQGARVHSENSALWHAAGRGELGFRVAKPLRWDPTTRSLWQERLHGIPLVAALFGTQGLGIATRMGQALASLARAQLEPELLFDGPAQLARSVRYGAELSARLPGAAAAVDTLLDRLHTIHSAAGTGRLRPIHRAPHAHQWLDDGFHLGLVDFDGIARGDPELDAATILAELDFEDGLGVPVRYLAEAFVAGYEGVAGALDRHLLHAYRAHKGLAKALKAARAVRPDGDRRAERKLQNVLQRTLGEPV